MKNNIYWKMLTISTPRIEFIDIIVLVLFIFDFKLIGCRVHSRCNKYNPVVWVMCTLSVIVNLFRMGFTKSASHVDKELGRWRPTKYYIFDDE